MNRGGCRLPPLTLFVEKQEPLAQLRVDRKKIRFKRIGEQRPLRVIGTFPDGTKLTISQSGLTTYISSDTSVATVDHFGIVTARGPGATDIIVGYHGGHAVANPEIE